MADAPPRGRLALLFSRQEIARAVGRLARELDADYADTPPVLVGILKGAFVFLADLARTMTVEVRRIELLRFSSYGASTSAEAPPRVVSGLPRGALRGEHAVVVEDIVDSGTTTAAALRYVRRQGAASVRLCALLDKPARRRVQVPIAYLGLTVPDRFIVGYGLDLAERYRALPDIHTVED